MDEKWIPNLFIAGTPKAGTTSLHAWLADHPDAVGSLEKETHFFVDPGTHMYRPDFNIVNGLEEYRAQFPLAKGSRPRVILEATPSYIYHWAALWHIPDLPSRPHCLFVLREPASQIHALYTYFRGDRGWIPAAMSFADFVAAIRTGSHDFRGNELVRHALDNARYAMHLERWRARLGDDRMMVVTFDDLERDPAALTRRVAAWIGLEPGFYETYGFTRQNEADLPRNIALRNAGIALRGLLRKGGFSRLARSKHVRANSRQAEAPDARDAALLRALRAEFAPENRRLARSFGLDVAAWT